MKKIVCGRENVESFRAELKAAVPDFYSLAKDLYQKGLITGLRGAVLEIGLIPEQNDKVEMPVKAKSRECQECGQWRRDKVGDGTGIGLCLLSEQPTKVKWPGTEACSKFEALA